MDPTAPRRKPFTETPGHRQVRSFVLRQGRLTAGQQRALDTLWPRYGLSFPDDNDRLAALLATPSDTVVEIGFGNGEQLCFSCQNEPQRQFIGLEVHAPGVGRLLHDAAQAGIGNLHVYCHDAVEVLRDAIPLGSLAEIRIYFPDPWHKKKHQKRRLVQAAFVSLLTGCLRPGGLLHLATDWEDYAGQMRDVCEAEPKLVNVADPGACIPRPDWRRETHFERRGLRLGHGVWDFLYRRR